MSGAFAIYVACHGWAITPFTACLGWLDIHGYDSSDGRRARYVFSAYYSGNAYRVFSEVYREPVLKGDSNIDVRGDLHTGVGGPEGLEAIRIVIRDRGEGISGRGGVPYYIRPLDSRSVTIRRVACGSAAFAADPVSLVVTPPPGSILEKLRPRALLWARRLEQLSQVFSEPTRVALSEAGAIDGELLLVLSRLKVAAILVNAEGRVFGVNAFAENLLGDGLSIRHARLQVASSASPALFQMLRNTDGVGEQSLVVLPRSNGRWPLLVSLVPLIAVAKLTQDHGGELKLLLISDLHPTAGRTVVEGLTLLGLTPAESKAATLVGSGMSPREAALALGNTEATTRSVLKQVYAKLNIARQSELAGLVARLGAVIE